MVSLPLIQGSGVGGREEEKLTPDPFIEILQLLSIVNQGTQSVVAG